METSEIATVTNLESEEASLSFFCRLQRAFYRLFAWIVGAFIRKPHSFLLNSSRSVKCLQFKNFVVVVVLLCTVGSLILLTRKYRRRKEESKIVMELVEKIIGCGPHFYLKMQECSHDRVFNVASLCPQQLSRNTIELARKTVRSSHTSLSSTFAIS